MKQGLEYAMRTIQVLFYRPSAQDPLMNRIVAYIDPPFSHVEVRFEDGMASSIFSGESVFFRPRTFANPHYTIITLTVPEQDYRKMHRRCYDCAEEQVAFDSYGMYTSILTIFPSFQSPRKTFCSKYVCEVLQMGGVKEVQGQRPETMTPSKLHNLLQRSQRALFGSVPFKLEQVVKSRSR